jgi:2-haloacid dehalogenase
LFTDDRAENISAAQARGWQTHLFDGPQGLARRLVDAGLLTPEAAE